jgi:hypothetical protein
VSTREKVLEFAHSAPSGQWWSLAALIADVKARAPDFQRPAGDYDSWYLRHPSTGSYLRGFEHWDAVDGALLRITLCGPMYWLGFIDLASPGVGQPAAAFRWSPWAETLLNGEAPLGLQIEREKLKVDSQGKLTIPRLVQRPVRYQIARFCEWLLPKREAYQYRVSSRSLGRARRQGLEVRQLLSLLKANSAVSLPPNLLQALKRWEQYGTQARLQHHLILRVSSSAALKALRASRAARYLDDPLGPTTITVKPGAGQQVLQILTELGYLGELDEGG